jgi:hypothetical protein
VEALKKANPEAEIKVSLPDEKLAEQIRGTDIVINMITGIAPMVSAMKLEGVPEYDPGKAKLTLETLALLPALDALDLLAKAYLSAESSGPIINAGDAPDIVTGYLAVKHGIVSYGIAPKADNAVAALIKATGLKYAPEKLKVKGAGMRDMLWLYEIKDGKGKDLIPEFKAAAQGETLSLKRYELTGDGLKSLKFYGYYHSANAASEDTAALLVKIVGALSAEKESELYLLSMNNGNIYGLPEVPLELTVKAAGYKLGAEKADLPLQCSLALNDYLGALSVAIKALTERSSILFKRMFKLEPYTASILTLAEAEAAAEAALKGNEFANVLGRDKK